MTDRAQEVFTMQLARAAGQRANKFLFKRGLQKADRDDVISAALLWCWVNRDNYSLTTTLETWFMNAVRNSYQTWRRGSLPVGDVAVSNLLSASNVQKQSAVRSMLKHLVKNLTEAEQQIVGAIAQGQTYRDLMARGISRRAIGSAMSHARRLLHVREAEGYDFDIAQETLIALSTRTPPAPSLDDLDEQEEREASAIDIEIERLDFPPPSGKDCPPCWRCMWFEGFMPDGKLSTRLVIEDEEVHSSVVEIEARKMEIAQQIRDDAFDWNRRV